MKFIFRLLMLIAAGWLGTQFYLHAQQVKAERAAQENQPEADANDSSLFNNNDTTDDSRNRRFKGGIGRVGNPHSSTINPR